MITQYVFRLNTVKFETQKYFTFYLAIVVGVFSTLSRGVASTHRNRLVVIVLPAHKTLKPSKRIFIAISTTE